MTKYNEPSKCPDLTGLVFLENKQSTYWKVCGKAKETLSMDEYKERMKGIWSSCISTKTLDESPMAYKGMDYIVEHIKPTVEIISILKPVYNFKAVE